MRFWAFKAVYLFLAFILSSQVWALDPNACKNPTKNGMEDELRQDWSGHQRFLKSTNRLNSLGSSRSVLAVQ